MRMRIFYINVPKQYVLHNRHIEFISTTMINDFVLGKWKGRQEIVGEFWSQYKVIWKCVFN